MIDEREIRELLQRRAGTVPAVPTDTPTAVRRARRRLALNGTLATAAVVAIAVATLTGFDVIRTAPTPADSPAPAPAVMRRNAEVLGFTGVSEPTIADGSLSTPGDLVAVDPRTGQERVLVEDLDNLYAAEWSADGRWLLYVTDATDGVGVELWVVGGSQGPRVVATGRSPINNTDPSAEVAWRWSPTGARLATIENSETLRTIDLTTGEATDLTSVVADLLQQPGVMAKWAWSADGTQLVFASPWGTPEASLTAVDVRGGERSILARLPGSVEELLWSPDGAHVAVQTRVDGSHLYVMDADGSDVRMVTDDSDSIGFAWSPDGTRLAFGSSAADPRIWVMTTDGAPPAEIGTVGRHECLRASWGQGALECSVTWSPDGTQVAFLTGETDRVTVFDAAGSGEGESLDVLTYLSWDGGWYVQWLEGTR